MLIQADRIPPALCHFDSTTTGAIRSCYDLGGFPGQHPWLLWISVIKRYIKIMDHRECRVHEMIWHLPRYRDNCSCSGLHKSIKLRLHQRNTNIHDTKVQQILCQTIVIMAQVTLIMFYSCTNVSTLHYIYIISIVLVLCGLYMYITLYLYDNYVLRLMGRQLRLH